MYAGLCCVVLHCCKCPGNVREVVLTSLVAHSAGSEFSFEQHFKNVYGFLLCWHQSQIYLNKSIISGVESTVQVHRKRTRNHKCCQHLLKLPGRKWSGRSAAVLAHFFICWYFWMLYKEQSQKRLKKSVVKISIVTFYWFFRTFRAGRGVKMSLREQKQTQYIP